jgi:hypothetical protein
VTKAKTKIDIPEVTIENNAATSVSHPTAALLWLASATVVVVVVVDDVDVDVGVEATGLPGPLPGTLKGPLRVTAKVDDELILVVSVLVVEVIPPPV